MQFSHPVTHLFSWLSVHVHLIHSQIAVVLCLLTYFTYDRSVGHQSKRIVVPHVTSESEGHDGVKLGRLFTFTVCTINRLPFVESDEIHGTSTVMWLAPGCFREIFKMVYISEKWCTFKENIGGIPQNCQCRCYAISSVCLTFHLSFCLLKLGIMTGRASLKSWLTFGGDPVPVMDSRSLFHFPHHCRIGDFNRFISFYRTVAGRQTSLMLKC